MRFCYWSGATRERAEYILEDCYATGEIDQTDKAEIVKRDGRWRIEIDVEHRD